MENRTMFFVGREYIAPTIDAYSVKAERGYQASLGGGIIDDATNENWGNL